MGDMKLRTVPRGAYSVGQPCAPLWGAYPVGQPCAPLTRSLTDRSLLHVEPLDSIGWQLLYPGRVGLSDGDQEVWGPGVREGSGLLMP